MPLWLIILIVVAIIGAIFGAITDDSPGAGAFAAVMGCGSILLRIFLIGLSILFALWLFGLLFC